ncbi:lysylphosphatidylglycerol synthase domain-containing protein [Mangrovibacter yixingensis]|uniref:lysylphosphatidylglycerol synthase domain-containing protein n=1 Tax=Mangrovibacter yixingensis TaxID=1529639 RepID=UPI001CF9C2D9|nr:lysylphosphatidylglycerol synthase domain-containing protein [Mangrovibacter yixingensis]
MSLLHRSLPAHYRRRVKQGLSGVFLLAVVVLLVLYARQVDWQEVWQALLTYNRNALLSAAGLVVVSYVIYGLYDLLSKSWSGHGLNARIVMLVSFICYAFNLTLSTWVGGIGMRYRLYSRLGLGSGTIARIFSFSIMTNWLGYVLVGGILFTFGTLHLPSGWYIDTLTLRCIGGVLLALSLGWLLLCSFSPKRTWRVRGRRVRLPGARFTIMQFLLSALNWLIMGATIWLLMQQQVDFMTVLAVTLLSSIAGVIIHIPAGIGVLEAVFLALLPSSQISHGSIIAALLVWRALYYFIPLIIAAVCYAVLEGKAGKLRKEGEVKRNQVGAVKTRATGLQ